MKFRGIGKDIHTGNFNIIFEDDDETGWVKITNLNLSDLDDMINEINKFLNTV